RFSAYTAIATSAGLAGLGGHQSQAIALLCPGWRCSSRFTTAGVQLALNRTTGSPCIHLPLEFRSSLAAATPGNLPGIRQLQHLAGFQPVDIAVNEGIRIKVLDGQHDLMHRTTATVGTQGNFPQGIVLLYT